MKRGNCYVTCEALYHLLGGSEAGWSVKNLKHEGDSHWYLELWDIANGNGWEPILLVRLDPTVSQFKRKPDYSRGRSRGFLTKTPSKRALAMMEKMVWQK